MVLCSVPPAAQRASSACRGARDECQGPRPSGSSDAAFLGGQVAHWTGHGCHPSRGYAYPRYPELATPPRDLDIGPHDYRVTSFNNRADGAIAFDWETPSG